MPDTKLKKHTIECYDWHEVVEIVEINCNRDVRDWANSDVGVRTNIPYQDFWHVIVDMCDIHTGCYIDIDFEESFMPYEGEESYMVDKHGEWVKEVAAEFLKVVGPGEHKFWVSW
jgi:hypothetical protein